MYFIDVIIIIFIYFSVSRATLVRTTASPLIGYACFHMLINF